MKFKMGGSGIHIKPENKGKFTATKKATGKSTEELTHSKNPVTKKRAIFAQNAAKWKHQDGSRKISTPDSTEYYGKQMEKFMKKRSSVRIDKAPPYDQKANKAMSDMYRQTKKGKEGYDENGHPIAKKMCGSKGMKYQAGSSNVSMNLNDSNKIPKPTEKTKKFISNNTKTSIYDSNKSDESIETRKIPAYVDKKQSVVIKPKTSIYDSDKSNLLNKKSKYAEGTKSIKFKKPMMKRADGSTSQRGLWDNIRANKGSGKKPTPEMLKQEKKIKAGK